MNTLTIGKKNSIIPGLFQIAAKIEKPVTPAIDKPAAAITEKEFAALRMEALKSTGPESMRLTTKTPAVEACGWTFTIRKECSPAGHRVGQHESADARC